MTEHTTIHINENIWEIVNYWLFVSLAIGNGIILGFLLYQFGLDVNFFISILAIHNDCIDPLCINI
jgi:hypothetical protein